MKTSFFAFFCAILLSVSSADAALNAWFNEFHYDNASTDVGEFVEFVAPSSVNVNDLAVTFYNGANGASYSPTSPTLGTGQSINGFTVYSISASGIQNGNPDGFALSYSGSVVQFLSYGGSFTASGGVADGLTSTDVGVTESGTSTPIGASLGLTGTGSAYGDFMWTTFTTDSKGSVNVGQTLVAVPEPAEWGSISAAVLVAVCGLRVWRRRVQAAAA